MRLNGQSFPLAHPKIANTNNDSTKKGKKFTRTTTICANLPAKISIQLIFCIEENKNIKNQ
jgi:hypothetical protein